LFSNVSDNLIGGDFQNIEVNSLGQRSALSNQDNVTFLDSESRGAVSRDVSVSFFVSVVFGDVVEIIPSDDNSPLHFS